MPLFGSGEAVKIYISAIGGSVVVKRRQRLRHYLVLKVFFPPLTQGAFFYGQFVEPLKPH